MPDILLTTLNAKFIHASFGLRCLFANLGDLIPRSQLIEFDIKQRPLDIAEALLAQKPQIIGFGVYIWNTLQTRQVLSILKQLQPSIQLVLGGPEVSHETHLQEITALADFVITGEADLEFARLCRRLLAHDLPTSKVIHASLPDLNEIAPPYAFYTDDDIRHRIVYVEASRGCPFTCEFCLSSLDVPVRQFSTGPFLDELQKLLDRGLRHFKFVDRTFNLNPQTSSQILRFFLDRYVEGLFVHFEMIPDRLPEGLRTLIAQFPPGSVQFEVGIQTFNPAVSQNISRRQDYSKLTDNFAFLTQHTGVHIHADLIVGLPGETVESFGSGFDRLLQMGPQEIQVGVLKRLRGTPIIRHDAEWMMLYSPDPPYEILQTKTIDFATMQRLRRFARYWDLVGNSGNFKSCTRLICGSKESAFDALLAFSDHLYQTTRRTHGIALSILSELVFNYLINHIHVQAPTAAQALWSDFLQSNRTEIPPFLKPHLPVETAPSPRKRSSSPPRQRRHLESSPQG